MSDVIYSQEVNVSDYTNVRRIDVLRLCYYSPPSLHRAGNIGLRLVRPSVNTRFSEMA